MLPLAAAAAFVSPAAAQTHFNAQVVEEGTAKAVRSDIEYEAAPGSWRIIKATDGGGKLADRCPGPGRIRANPTPYYFHYRISLPAACGGTVPFAVEKRELSEIFRNHMQYSALSRTAFAEAYLEGLLASDSAPARSEAEARLLETYAADEARLSVEDRQRVETMILNQSAGAFDSVDLNSDNRLSAGEINAAISPPP
jgi:hypothetical protein